MINEETLDGICGFAREIEGYAKSIQRWSCDEDPDMEDLHFYLEEIQDAVDCAREFLCELKAVSEVSDEA